MPRINLRLVQFITSSIVIMYRFIAGVITFRNEWHRVW